MKKYFVFLGLLLAAGLQAQCPIPAYTYLGSYNGHHYYLSNEWNSWEIANARAYARGGYLAAINDAAENQVVADWVNAYGSFEAWIGINDIASEGNFEWTSGDPVTYTNWAPGEPNDFNIGEDYAVINWWSYLYGPGYWNDLGVPDGDRPSVIEIGEDNSACPLECHAYLGSFEGHDYYVSTDFTTWTTADANAQALGGYLVSIGSAAENAFIESYFPGADWLWIGLSDAAEEGTFTWSNGDPLTYSNWAPFEPNNSGNEDYAIIWADGTWNDLGEGWYLPYIVEFSGDSDCDGVNDFCDGSFDDADCDGVGDGCDHCPGGDDSGPCDATSFPGFDNIPAHWVCHDNGRKVFMCHDGVTICIDVNAVQAHLDHGDFLGPCVNCIEPRSAGGTSGLDLHVYPNPAFDQVTVRIEGLGEPGMLSLFNQVGHRIHQVLLPADASQIQLSLDQYPAGLYYLQLSSRTENLTRRIMIAQ